MREIYKFVLKDNGEVVLLINSDLLKDYKVTEQELKENIDYDLIDNLTENIVEILKGNFKK